MSCKIWALVSPQPMAVLRGVSNQFWWNVCFWTNTWRHLPYLRFTGELPSLLYSTYSSVGNWCVRNYTPSKTFSTRVYSNTGSKLKDSLTNPAGSKQGDVRSEGWLKGAVMDWPQPHSHSSPQEQGMKRWRQDWKRYVGKVLFQFVSHNPNLL